MLIKLSRNKFNQNIQKVYLNSNTNCPSAYVYRCFHGWLNKPDESVSFDIFRLQEYLHEKKNEERKTERSVTRDTAQD